MTYVVNKLRVFTKLEMLQVIAERNSQYIVHYVQFTSTAHYQHYKK